MTEEELLGYGLLGEAVTRETLPDERLGELMLTAAETTDKTAPLYEKIAAVARCAYRAGASAALYLSERDQERLLQAFADLLDHPQREEG